MCGQENVFNRFEIFLTHELFNLIFLLLEFVFLILNTESCCFHHLIVLFSIVRFAIKTDHMQNHLITRIFTCLHTNVLLLLYFSDLF